MGHTQVLVASQLSVWWFGFAGSLSTMGSLLFILLLLASTALHPGSPMPARAPHPRLPHLGSQALSRTLVLRAVSGLLRAELPPQDVATPWHPPPASPRERKTGCKSFYWKTLTSC